MRAIKVCICALLALAVSLCAAQTPAEQGQKVIHDPVEYNEYITALNAPDPSQKAASMEAFVARYPSSPVLEDALEQLLAAYEATGKTAEAERTAKRILELNENNVRALAIVVFLTRNALTSSGKDQMLPDLRLWAERGLRLLPEWQKPDQMSAPDFEKLKDQVTVIFYGGAGFAALRKKEYSAARDFYTPAVALDPDDLQNTYQLSIADLEMANLDVRGFWYVVRAIHLCDKQKNVTAVRMITNYGLAKYRKYHGSEEGWEQILQRVATARTPGPPRDFQVTPAVQASATPDGTAASLTSNSSPGNAHNASGSILLVPSLAPDPPRGAPASVLSSGSSGNAHGVPASVLSVNSPGTAHNVEASVTSSSPRAQGLSSGIAASILHTASASAVAVGRGMTVLSRSLRSQ